ncbi:MAG: inositol-3-phosphate synthase [Desulfohalobiaceae bacterium]|nr:inositol-3-phosphate synthase [Desulfohalobiaceae bacterium]
MSKVKIAVAGLGNCASSLIQGIHYYADRIPDEAVGLMHWSIGGYRPEDIQVVAAFDIDQRKVGKDVNSAIFSPPNCTKPIQPTLPPAGVTVKMGKILDGFSEHLQGYAPEQTFVLSEEIEPDFEDVVRELKKSQADMLLNYLPVGSEEAVRFYARAALEAGTGFINNIPVFIASDPKWAARFEEKGLPLIGDDVKSQLGATIVHRALTHLFGQRGVGLDRTYQLNTGGNTDFLNMLNRERVVSKKKSKTEAVQAVAKSRLKEENIHIGPSDYVAWQKDNKVCFLRMEGRLFGDVPMDLELRLSVEDSPNSAGIVIDAVRCMKLALDRGVGGVLEGPSAYFCKHPLRQYSDDRAWELTEAFINRH